MLDKIKDLVLDEERALYNITNTELVNIKIDGPADGESALKECENIKVDKCYFNLRYPLWHVNKCEINESNITEKSRAAIWYCKDFEINNSILNGIKAVRECSNFKISNSDIVSFEFGWKCKNLELIKTNITGEYLFLDSSIIKLNKVNLKGKYSFQYVNDLIIKDSDLDTKDAFWHAKNITVKNTVLKGEYLGWYSENLTLINCKIIGTQPLCYCKNLKLIDCTTEQCDLAFENSEVNGNIIGNIISIKNPLSGEIRVNSINEIINDDKKYNCNGKVIIK